MKMLSYALWLGLSFGSAQANTITSDSCALGARDFSVTATTVVQCLAVGAGNLTGNNDLFQQANAGWSFIDASNNTGGAHNGWLTGAPSLVSGLSGNFNINVLAYTSYDRIAIGFRSQTAQFNPDWAVFELADNTLTGTWSISGQQELTHARLYGFGTPTAVPEPGSLVLLGLGLSILAVLRRRSQI